MLYESEKHHKSVESIIKNYKKLKHNSLMTLMKIVLSSIHHIRVCCVVEEQKP